MAKKSYSAYIYACEHHEKKGAGKFVRMMVEAEREHLRDERADRRGADAQEREAAEHDEPGRRPLHAPRPRLGHQEPLAGFPFPSRHTRERFG